MNGRNDPYTCLGLSIFVDYIVITDIHQNYNFGAIVGEQKLEPLRSEERRVGKECLE